MNTFFDETGFLNIDDLIERHPSFVKIVEDGVITEEEIKEQSDRVVALLKEFERTSSPEQIERFRELLTETSILVIVNSLFDKYN